MINSKIKTAKQNKKIENDSKRLKSKKRRKKKKKEKDTRINDWKKQSNNRCEYSIVNSQ